MTPEVKELFVDAQLKFINNDYEESIELFQKVLEIDPVCGKAHQAIAIAHIRQKEFDSALDSIDRAIKCEPENSRFHYHKGAILYQAQRHDEAIESLSRAIEIDPAYAAAYTLRSTVFETIGEEEAAGADLNFALNLRKEETKNAKIVDM